MAEIDIDNEPTVFILGAGVSNPYGFPLGDQLKVIIRDIPDAVVNPYIGNLKNLTQLVGRFKSALTYGDYGTIDQFLEQKPQYRELGSYYIVTAIGGREQPNNVFPQRDFYAELFNILNVESDADSIPPVSVVSLNYDRSLEQFLMKNVEYNCHGDVEEHALRKIKQLPIVHAHGSLGDIDLVPYGAASGDAASVQAASKRIRIVSDRMEDSAEFLKAQQLVSAATNVIFLGFGYHPSTLESLIAPCGIEKKRIYGTAWQLPKNRLEAVQVFFKDNGKFAPMNSVAFLEHLEIGRGKLKRAKYIKKPSLSS